MGKYVGLFVIFSLFIVTNAFGGPFGIDFGMSLERVRAISTTKLVNISDDLYILTPPNENKLFKTYVVQIHPTYGVYFIKAISKDISTNKQGTILKNQFDNLVSNIEKTYGKYKKDDSPVQGSYWGTQPEHYMYALSIDERILIAYWEKDKNSKLPPEILFIIVAAKGKNSSTGYLVLEYYSVNYEKIKEEQSSVF
jgi:hypothetical protein